jgi:hypothetical protein
MLSSSENAKVATSVIVEVSKDGKMYYNIILYSVDGLVELHPTVLNFKSPAEMLIERQ